jgi:type IV pilus assembly protein PilW
VVSAPRQAGRGAGFSLVELMVALVIGMLALMFATRIVLTGEQNKQASLGGSDAMQNGMLAMFSISSDAGQAGFGLNDPIVVGCDTRFIDASGYTLAPATRAGATIRPLAAAVIESNGALPDRLSLYSGTSLTGTGMLQVNQYAGAGQINVVSVPFGFAQGDVVVVANNSHADGTRCAISQITNNLGALPASPAQQYLRIDGTGRYTNRDLFGLTFPPNGTRVFNLGPEKDLSFHSYSVDAGYLKLQSTNLVGSSLNPTTVIDNVVSIKAQYGFDTRPAPSTPAACTAATVGRFCPADGMIISTWSSTMIDADGNGTAGGHLDYQRVAALRLAVVARSKSPEKPNSAGICSATTTQPVVFGTAVPQNVAAVPITLDVAVPNDPIDWKCYRYRAFETVVPLRNSGFRSN